MDSSSNPTPARGTSEKPAGLVLMWVFRAYWFVFTVFSGAGISAFLAHYIDEIAQYTGVEWPAYRAEHVGWILGFLFCLVAVPMGWFSATIGEARPIPDDQIKPVEVDRSYAKPNQSWSYAMRVGLVGGLVGFLLGIILGGTLFFIWLSIAMSPFGPLEWRTSLRMGLFFVMTSHPFAGWLWLSAMAGSAVFGFLLGVTGAASGDATAEWNGKPVE